MLVAPLCLLMAAGVPPALHAIASVNDPLSHGVVGDTLLSLNEAIRLHNGTLLYHQLSAAEQALVSVIPNTGGTTDVSWIDIDGGGTPVITIQQNLDPILDTPVGLFLRGTGDTVTLDFTGANVTQCLVAPANSVILQNLRILGGAIGVDITQTNATGQAGASLDDMEFEGQSQIGVRVGGGLAGGVGRVVLRRCSFDGVPTAIDYREPANDRDVIFELRESDIRGATAGVLYAGGTDGTARFTFERSTIEASSVGIDLDVAENLGRTTLIEGRHLRVRAPICARLGTATDATTWMQCAMWSLLASGGGSALELGGVDHDVYGDLLEFRCDGDVSIKVGGAAASLRLRNARCAGGAVTLSTSASQPLQITESRFDDCQIESDGTGTVAIDGSCVVGGTFGDASPAGAFQVMGSFVQSAGTGVQLTHPLPAAQLGSLHVTPDDAALGGTIQFAVDLPPGLVAVLVLGTVPLYQTVLPSPYYVYVDPLAAIALPGAFVLQQATTWTAPSQPQLAGIDLCVQPIVLAGPGVQGPPLQFAPGWRFVLR